MWHISGFNQLVEQHTSMLATALFEINEPSTSDEELQGIAAAIGAQARLLHSRGVGEPNEPGGWYHRLRNEVDADIGRLERTRRWKNLYGVADVFAVVLVMASLSAFGWAVSHSGNDKPSSRLPSLPTITTP